MIQTKHRVMLGRRALLEDITPQMAVHPQIERVQTALQIRTQHLLTRMRVRRKTTAQRGNITPTVRRLLLHVQTVPQIPG